MKSQLLILSALLLACGGSERVVLRPTPTPGSTAPQAPVSGTVPMLVDTITPQSMAARVAQFAPARLEYDASTLQDWEKQVLSKLVEASHVMHDIYTIQVSPQNPAWRAQLESQEGAGKEAASQIP